jgi:hypothetical protein
MKTQLKLFTLSMLLFSVIILSSFKTTNHSSVVSGKYYFNGLGTGSFFEFKKGGIVKSGNEKKGMINCLSEGKYVVKGKKITISELYNENCSSIEDRNGVYNIISVKSIQKEGDSYKWMK